MLSVAIAPGGAFHALTAWRQFIVYRLQPKPNQPGKADKLPINPTTGRTHSAHDSAIWLSADEAIAAAERLGPGFGVGFTFTRADPFWFLDADGCLQTDGTWSPLAVDMCTRLAGAAVEVSQSGKGLHIIGTNDAMPAHGCRNQAFGLELYHEGRFVALTGTHAGGDAGAYINGPLEGVIADYFPTVPSTGNERPTEWTTGPRDDWNGPTDDDELIQRARSTSGARQTFGGNASFDDLWTANPETLGRSYPDAYGDPPRPYDSSSADAALAAHLAFWTGCDCERMERLMRRSALMRDKWDRHGSYINRTITGAVSRCERVYSGKQTVAGTDPLIIEPEIVSGYQFMAISQQIDYFKNCVYVQEIHRIFTPQGALLKPEQFKATYGGYLFSLDAIGEKSTKSAWEAFTESQAIRYPIAEGMTFRPELRPGQLIKEEGRQLVNTYIPAEVERRRGDVSPFLDHLHRILPDEHDAMILLAYMAACVQHVGVKFQWCPLIQGVEGNGKTLFSRCVAHAVGMRYSHFPKADEISNKFNSWIVRKLFIGIEDVYYPHDRREIIESLKPMITNDVLPVEFKGVDQISAHICANFLLNSNHKDALRKTKNDRRFAIFFSAQQIADDITRDGMGGDYFPDLYEWLRRDGYAFVADYLATYPIPEALNPATSCHRAPITSTTDQAMAYSAGGVEQEVLEAIDEGRPGFAGGWVSSMALDKLLDNLRLTRAIPPNKRRELLNEMGYDWHPALHNGRVNNPTAIDGGKPKLFISNDHPDRNITVPALVSQAYQTAQHSVMFGVDNTVNKD